MEWLFHLQLPGKILALANSKELTFAAVGSDIWESKRLHRYATIAENSDRHMASVTSLPVYS